MTHDELIARCRKVANNARDKQGFLAIPAQDGVYVVAETFAREFEPLIALKDARIAALENAMNPEDISAIDTALDKFGIRD